MTFSIVARCPVSGHVGVAAATAMIGVGKLVAHAAGGAGAIATQAKLNPYIGLDGLMLLGRGWSATRIKAMTMGMDPGIEQRQFAIVDGAGNVASYTGTQTPDWSGDLQGEGYSLQGNRLAGQIVLESAKSAFEAGQGKPLVERFIAALDAGIAAGGDINGERSATVYIMDREAYPLWDIRVDDHPEPMSELKRLHSEFEQQLLPQMAAMPTRANPAGKEDESAA